MVYLSWHTSLAAMPRVRSTLEPCMNGIRNISHLVNMFVQTNTLERNDMNIDLGDLCTNCGRNTAWGSGRFINRIPSDTDATLKLQGIDPEVWPQMDDSASVVSVTVTGYMCVECQSFTCDRCNQPTAEYTTCDGFVKVCGDCL